MPLSRGPGDVEHRPLMRLIPDILRLRERTGYLPKDQQI